MKIAQILFVCLLFLGVNAVEAKDHGRHSKKEHRAMKHGKKNKHGKRKDVADAAAASEKQGLLPVDSKDVGSTSEDAHPTNTEEAK